MSAMMTREKSHYKVALLDKETNTPVEVMFSTYWCPTNVDPDCVAMSAAAQASTDARQPNRFSPISAQLVDADGVSIEMPPTPEKGFPISLHNH